MHTSELGTGSSQFHGGSLECWCGLPACAKPASWGWADAEACDRRPHRTNMPFLARCRPTPPKATWRGNLVSRMLLDLDQEALDTTASQPNGDPSSLRPYSSSRGLRRENWVQLATPQHHRWHALNPTNRFVQRRTQDDCCIHREAPTDFCEDASSSDNIQAYPSPTIKWRLAHEPYPRNATSRTKGSSTPVFLQDPISEWWIGRETTEEKRITS